MGFVSSASFGRAVIVLAVLLQAMGKVAFGTWLADLPSTLFVFISFTLAAVFFLAVSRRGVGKLMWGTVLLLNASTALTFICFFYALKLIEPAIVGAVDIGVGPVLAVLITLGLTGERPAPLRIVVCIGILVGCGVLAAAAVDGSGFATVGRGAWFGLMASVATGIGAVVITMTSKSLLNHGWKFGAVLAHRFYLLVPVSLALAAGTSDLGSIEWTGSLLVAILAVTVVGVIAPLYLLLVGISRCDPYTVMVTMAALPILTFAIEGFSPVYSWSWITAIGLAIVTTFLLVDVFARKS